jgi:hypothetical protein
MKLLPKLVANSCYYQDNLQIGAIEDIAAVAAGIGIFLWAAILTIEGIQLLAIV